MLECLMAYENKHLGFLFCFFKINLFIYLFIFGCVGSPFLCEGCLQLRRAGATLHCGARASRCCGLSRCGAQAPDAQVQQLWLTGLAAPRHVGSYRTEARTHVPKHLVLTSWFCGSGRETLTAVDWIQVFFSCCILGSLASWYMFFS